MSYEYEISSLRCQIGAREEEINRLNSFIRCVNEISGNGSRIPVERLELLQSEWRDITTNRSRSLPDHLHDVKREMLSKMDRMCQKAEKKKQEIQRQIHQCEQSIQNYRLKACEEVKQNGN